MNRMTVVACALVAAACCLGPAGAADSIVKATDKDNGKSISLAKGQALELTLGGNITTGYSWVVDKLDGKSLKQSGKVEYKRPELQAPGAPGTFIARWNAAAAGASKISMKYIRPWEKNQPPARTFTLDVKVAN